MSEMIDRLGKYFEETPREQVEADWKATEYLQAIGPTVNDFLDNTQSIMEKETPITQSIATDDKRLLSGSLPSLNEIQLEPVYGSTHCRYSVLEQKLAILYRNQEKILQAIKLLGNDL